MDAGTATVAGAVVTALVGGASLLGAAVLSFISSGRTRAAEAAREQAEAERDERAAEAARLDGERAYLAELQRRITEQHLGEIARLSAEVDRLRRQLDPPRTP